MGIGAGASLALGFYGFVSIALFEKAKGLIEQHANLLQIAVAVVFGAMALKGLLAVKGDAALSAVSNEAQMVSLNKNVSLNENVALNDRFGASFLSGSVISFLRPVTVLIVAGILSAVFANVNGNLAAQLQKEQNPWVFAVSAFLANLAWFAVLVVFANWLKNKMSAKNILRLRAVLLFGLLLFALTLFSRGILLATA